MKIWMDFQKELKDWGNGNMLNNFSSDFIKLKQDHLSIQRA